MIATPSPESLISVARNPAMLDALADIASAAGAVIMPYLAHVAAETKADGSPVTMADREAEALILARLATLLPGVPVVSEEAASEGRIPAIGEDFILVDALDGTKEFLARAAHFTVNIGLVHRGQPVAGVVYAPALQQLWLAGARAETLRLTPGQSVREARGRSPIHIRPFPNGPVTAMSSLRHQNAETEGFLSRLPLARHERAGSSLKFCLLAEGRADVYPRFSPTMEWDTAAGDAVVRAAGGVVMTLDGAPLAYGKVAAGYRNPGFVATSDWRRCAALAGLPAPD